MTGKFHEYLEVVAIVVFLLAGFYWLQEEFAGGAEPAASTNELGLMRKWPAPERIFDVTVPGKRHPETGTAVRGPVQEALRVAPTRPQADKMVCFPGDRCGAARGAAAD